MFPAQRVIDRRTQHGRLLFLSDEGNQFRKTTNNSRIKNRPSRCKKKSRSMFFCPRSGYKKDIHLRNAAISKYIHHIKSSDSVLYTRAQKNTKGFPSSAPFFPKLFSTVVRFNAHGFLNVKCAGVQGLVGEERCNKTLGKGDEREVVMMGYKPNRLFPLLQVFIFI